MRGACLFLITILLVTSSGRSALETYSSLTLDRFAEQPPYSYMALVFMAAIALVLRMMMRHQRRERPDTSFVWLEIRGPVGAEHPQRIQKPRRSARLRAFFRRLCGLDHTLA